MWCVDCTCHLCNNVTRFVNLSDNNIKSVSPANNGTTEVTGLIKTFIKAEVNTDKGTNFGEAHTYH